MPPRKRQAPVEPDVPTDPALCPEDFPAGWPEGAEQSVGCVHGMWVRPWPPEPKKDSVPVVPATPSAVTAPSPKTDGGE